MQEKGSLTIHKQTLPFLNISLYLNDIKPIQSLAIENTTEINSDSLEIEITADLPCFEPFNFSISSIPAKKQVKIPLDNLKVNRGFLNQLSETERASITIKISQNEIVVIEDNIPISIHPLEYFGGFQVMPELLASYVTPNHPYIYHLKRKAVEILEKQGLTTAFEGYQSDDPERVLQVISAIYSAVQSEEIIYSSLPPGYEEIGQRLRLLNTIQQEKFGNCIDISLLFAACLEAVDLNPILIIVRGHTFVGCWLQDERFSEVVNDDKSAITKRLSKGIREMAAFEATSVCKGNNIKFSDALNSGEAQLVQKENFLLSVDVKRARTLRIRPLPLKTNTTTVQLDEEAIEKEEIASMEKDFDLGTIYEDDLLQDKQPKTKQKVWERKLLDLSLRNNLLNLRMTRNMLQLVDIDITQLEDTLWDGKSFSILPAPNAEVLRKYNLFTQPLHPSSPLYQLANDELKHYKLLTHYHQQDLDNILLHIHKNARQSIEENGSSTLYLGVGLLKWFDRKNIERPRYAPILLLPVEINRRSVNSKFTLRSREEETMINITLIEFLRQEYELDLSVLENLPTDEKGVDVAKVMGIIRRAIMQLKGWDVEEQLVLGNFSFNRLILWKDIVVNQDKLLESNMVRSLVEGKLTFDDSQEIQNSSDFENIESKEVILPIATDVSQLEAVIAAQQGQSFILHGPPGTGKSQTITNIIADALYHDKRVLFVAAKKAALDVVHRRLEKIGLAPFTLELHSNKSKKSDVLAQLARSIETGRLAQSANFEQEAERLDNAKKAISKYVKVLHQKHNAGWSLYDSITTLENYKKHNFPNNFITDVVLQKLAPNLWQQWSDWLPQFQLMTKLIVHPSENPLVAFDLPNFTSSINDEVIMQTKNLLELLLNVKSKSQELKTEISFPFSISSKNEWDNFVQIATVFQKLPDIHLQIISHLSDKENYKTYEEWNDMFGKYLSYLNAILTHFNRSILKVDVSTIEIKWRKAQQSWFLPKWFQSRKIEKELSIYRTSPFNDINEIEKFFIDFNQMQELQLQLQQNRFETLQNKLKNLYKGEQTELNDIQEKAKLINQISNLTNIWGRNSLTKLVNIWEEKGLQYSDEVKQKNLSLINDFVNVAQAFGEMKKYYKTLTGIRFQQTNNWNDETISQLEKIQEHFPNLRDWMNYVQLRKRGETMDLQWLINSFEQKLCNSDNITDYFNYTVHTSIIRQVIEKNESLSLFNAELFENKIEQYKKIAKDFQYLTVQELRVKLSSQLPNTTAEAMQSSEIGILQRAIKSRGRGISIRRLFDQIPTLLPRIAPCMLMSPISVAQYFDVNTDHFDILIFDEASQLPTYEAISALARAKQTVIVGDPKQMPPTSFFNSMKIDEDNMELEDLESILDDCLSLSVPSKYLLRHYRSKHESLIAFSNVNYYDNKLLTFPSADDLNKKVQYHNIPGFYDKGKSRTNKFEADAIVKYVEAHYSNPQKRKLSLGVVTFSQAQQSLIEDKLQKLFMSNPDIEEYANENYESLFVKNLENVQGDERDIILFSIGYAPDEQGKMSMNFGPLNREGGWRRLNVAITRARYEMHIFATLRADEIDLNRTASEGVAGLKSFLQFAEKGQLTISHQDAEESLNKQHLSMAISKKLQEKGLEAKYNIGTSAFKVDIGVVHPDKPEQYILGIIVDGQHYYNAHTTNDREMVMPSVLKGLGWNIHRIWTIDWYENSDKIIETIIERVEKLQSEPQVNEIAEPEPDIKHEFEPAKAIEKEPIVSKQIPYEAFELEIVTNGNSENIHDYHNHSLIKKQMQALVVTESPISKGLLYKKVLQVWNISRSGARIERLFEKLIQSMSFVETNHHQPFYWNENTTIDYYRSNDIEKRNMEDIAPEEILVALEEVIINNFSIDEAEVMRYLARTFGFAKVGKQIESLLQNVIDLAVKQEIIKREDERIILVKK